MANDVLDKYVELDERVTRHTEQIKTCFNQIAEVKTLVESVHKLAITVEILARGQKDINNKMDNLTGDVEEIKEKPARRWDTIITVGITAIVTALITLLFAGVGLN